MQATTHSQIRKPQTRTKSRSPWIPVLAVVILLAIAGGGYYYWTQQKAKAAAQTTQAAFSTSQVRRGDLSVSASGSGTLAAGVESALSFSTTGTVAKVNVQVGDQVKKGQALAVLANLDTLQANVDAAQQNLASAQQDLDTLKQQAAQNLANAQLAVSNDIKAVDTAKAGLIQPGMARCDLTTTDAYYSVYMQAQKDLQSLGDGGGNQDYYLKQIVPAKNKVAQAYSNYQWCAGFTDYETSGSQAKLALAQAQLKTAQDSLATLQKNNGIDPTALAQAQNKVDNAQSALDQAKATFSGTTLTAPFDGTVLSVAGQAGDQVTTSAFITIADLVHPQIAFSVDETDLDKVSKGEQVQVEFDALPNQTFTGTVTRIDPSLQTVNNYQVVTGLIQLDLSQVKNPPTLMKGLNATVTLIKAQSTNTLLIPLQALHDLGDGTYGVFVLDATGQPKFKVVQIGLQDSANVEIKQGLSAGDVVTTGSKGQ